jgi:hypothetical protein
LEARVPFIFQFPTTKRRGIAHPHPEFTKLVDYTAAQQQGQTVMPLFDLAQERARHLDRATSA